jgi:inhibitor of cysteine peptidase
VGGKPVTRAFSLILAVLMGLCISACAENQRAARTFPERIREFTDPLQTIQVTVGETFSIVLDSNPTTGYTWQRQDKAGDGVVIFANSRFVAARPDLAGAGGRDHITFRATAPGTEKLTFHYVRPWEKNTKPARTVVFTVTVR